jgi:two-component system response regulator FixJ
MRNQSMVDEAIVHIIDDDRAIRDSLGLLLQTEGYVVRTYESARIFLSDVTESERGCVVTDVRMPEITGLDLLSAMRERHIFMPIILITAHADVPLAVQAMKMGAIDLIEKPFDDEALLAAIRQALKRWNDDATRVAKTQSIRARLATLTRRENEVLNGLLKGQPNKVIAHELGISMRTVEVHRASVMAKMEARSLPELVQLALAGSQEDSGSGHA